MWHAVRIVSQCASEWGPGPPPLQRERDRISDSLDDTCFLVNSVHTRSERLGAKGNDGGGVGGVVGCMGEVWVCVGARGGGG